MLVAASSPSGCGKVRDGGDNQALLTSIGSVSIYRYHASRPVNSYKIEIDGEEYTSGSSADASQDLELAVIRCKSETRFHFRIGGGVNSFSVPNWEEDDARSTETSIANRNSLDVQGPTQLYRTIEKSMDDTKKTRTVRLLVE